MIGSTLSNCTILEKLGMRRMGVVYKARDAKLDRVAALKLLPPSASDTTDARLRQWCGETTGRVSGGKSGGTVSIEWQQSESGQILSD